MASSEWIEKLRAAAAMCQSPDDDLDYKYWAAVAFGMLPKASVRITELEAQVAALQEIAGEERVRLIARCVHDCPEGGCLVDEERISETVESIGGDLKEQARRQLAEEHPEAFR